MAIHINLYDPTLRRRRDWLSLGNVVAAVLLLFVAVGSSGYLVRQEAAFLAALSATEENQLASLRAQVETLTAQVAVRKPDAQLEKQLASLQAELGLRTEALNTLRRSMSGVERADYTDYLLALSRQSLDGLWLTEIQVAEDGRMAISGCTTDPALLPEYIHRLKSEPAFQGQTFANLKIGEEMPSGNEPPRPLPLALSLAGQALAGQAQATQPQTIPCPHQFALAPLPDEAISAQSSATDAPGRPG